MKLIKKLLFVLLASITMVLAIGCNINFGNGGTVNVDPKDNKDLQEVFNEIVESLGDRSAITADMLLPLTKDDVSIVWSSDKPEVISNDGKVTRGLDDERVTLTCLLKFGEQTKQFSLYVTVKGNRSEEPSGYDKIGDVLKLEDGANANVRGTVVATTSQSFLVKDDSGFILVYKGKNWTPDLEAGNIVTVSGAIASYAGMRQFGNDATYEKQDGQGSDSGTFEELDAAKFDALLEETSVKLVALTGKLVKSGNYWNFEVEGSSNKGSISYPATDLTSFDGKNVKITGYFVGVTGSTTKYINFILVSINEAGGGTPVVVPGEEKTIAEILAGELGNYKTSGVVVAITSQSFLIEDNGSYILVYQGKNWTANVEAGDKVTVSGDVSEYAGMKQFGASATYEKTGTAEITLPEALELTGDGVDGLVEEGKVKYLVVNGDLAKSGNYWNLTVEGTTYVGSISYPATDLTSYDGDKVNVTGYFVGVTGSTTKYLTIILTEIEEDNNVTLIETDPVTIKEVLEGTVGAGYKTSGTVVAVNAQSFLVQDDSGIILAFLGTDYKKDLAVGDVVNVEGKTANYKGSVQFSKPLYEKTGETKIVTYPEPIVLDVEKFEALNTDKPVTTYVELLAELLIDDKYVNLYMGDAEVTGSVAYPAEDLSGFNGKLVVVTGYYTYATGSDEVFISIIATNLREATDAEVVNYIKEDYDSTALFDVVSSIGLPEEAYGATITWVSSNEAVLTSAGDYLVPSVDTIVKFTATITKGEATATSEISFNVKAPETIASILSMEELDEDEHLVKGVVVATYAQGFLIKDETGYILVYKGNGYEKDLEVGKVVLVDGYVVEYGEARQFSQDAIYKVLGDETFTQPEPRALDEESFTALAENVQVEYVKFSGMLSFSSGRFYNIAVGESTITGSIATPVENYQALSGKKIDVVGYFAYVVTSGERKYAYFITTSVEESPLTSEEYVALAETEVLKMNGKSYKKDLTLPLESNKCTISWVSSNTAIIANDGKFTMPETNTEVKLTATIVHGEVTKTVEVTVTALYVDPNAVLPIMLDLGSHDDFATWSNTYTAHELVFDDVKVEFTRADKQTGTVTDAPVLACNSSNPTVYAIVTGNLEGMKYARVITKEWNAGATAKYGDIHLEYTTDGTTWVSCSDVYTEPGTMVSTEMSDIKAFRLSYSMKEGSSGNAQLPLVSIEFAATAFPNE